MYLVWLKYLKKLLQDSVSGPFVVLFDESLNTKAEATAKLTFVIQAIALR